MPYIDPSQTEFGQSLPPHGPHTITVTAHGWEMALKFRDGDMSVISQMKSMYPRFGPFGVSAALCRAITQKVKAPEGYMCAAFLTPDVWFSNQERGVSEYRKEHKLEASEFRYYVVDVQLPGLEKKTSTTTPIRLYAYGFPMTKMQGASFMWQHGGLGFSTRLAEAILPHVDSATCVGPLSLEGEREEIPPPTYLPEGKAHEFLRKRIASLMMRANAGDEPPKDTVKSDDVYLFSNGMAAINRFHEILSDVNKRLGQNQGPVVAIGAVFHSTYHVFEESALGIKHYGRADDPTVLDDFEGYLNGGGKCSYVFTEFPSNPILASVDLLRLRKLADKYDFLIAVDDTVASFCNIDVLPAADVVITSLTKSFSGYADVMGGSVVLNPNMSSYRRLKSAFSDAFHNEVFEGDARQLLENSDDYLERSKIYNRNGEALASYFHKVAQDPDSPVKGVRYPLFPNKLDGGGGSSNGTAKAASSATKMNLEPFMRKPTPDFPKPGYGCLLSVDLETVDDAALFYDNLNFHHGPHLGAHLTLTLPLNMIAYGKLDPEYHASYGCRQEQVRISVGLEDEEILLRVCEKAVKELVAARREGRGKGESNDNGSGLAKSLEEKVAADGDIKTGFDPLGGNSV